jgi:phage shock protein B
MNDDVLGILLGGLSIVILFLGLPWLVFHYVTQWKKAATLTGEDEKLLDELHDLARRLDERMCSIERIMTAENPNWRSIACDPAQTGIENSAMTNQPRRLER